MIYQLWFITMGIVGIIVFILAIFLIFGVSLIISFFIINWDDRSQIIEKKYLLYIISSIPGTIYSVILLLLESILDFWLNLIIILILASVSSIIVKYVRFKRYQFKRLTQGNVLKKGLNLLEVEELKVYYPLVGGILKRQIGAVKAVDGITFNIKTGETLGLVGESGCGKTTVARAILGLVSKETGNIIYHNEPISENYSTYLRQKIQMVFQDPDASLNPRMKVVDIISEPLKNLLGITSKNELRKHVLRLMDEVSLKQEHLDRYPHEFSGGQKQRIIIARALACNPELIILDEPTSALDVSVQAQILNLLKDLQELYQYGFLFITHNLAVVNHIADRIAIMYLGKLVEIGNTEQIFTNPSHPYTQALLASRSEIDPFNQNISFVIRGEVPSPINPPSGCPFNPRCSSEARTNKCLQLYPHKIKIEDGHYIWCNASPKK
ncbi:MAG: ABC transporter ATP-binding protein [Candidatus Thorarchaeota archaeon]